MFVEKDLTEQEFYRYIFNEYKHSEYETLADD